MQNFFIKTRDELCKNGELLLTPALSYTERHLAQDLEEEQRDKQEQEKLEPMAAEDAATPLDGSKLSVETGESSMEAGGRMVS